MGKQKPAICKGHEEPMYNFFGHHMELSRECGQCVRFTTTKGDDEVKSINPVFCSPRLGFPFQIKPYDDAAKDFQ